MNSLQIIGNLTRDPEMRSTQDGKSVCNFTIAVNDPRKREEVEYFKVTTWEKMAENCQKFLAKGRKAAVTGSIHLKSYTAQDGKDRSYMEVRANSVEFLTPRTESSQEGFTEVEPPELPF